MVNYCRRLAFLWSLCCFPVIFLHAQADTAKSEPVYIVNGRIDTSIHSWNLETRFSQEMIESVNVLKGRAATDKYGSAAYGGAVEITLKGSELQKQDYSGGVPKIKLSELRVATVHSLLMLHKDIQVVSFSFTIDLPNGDIATVRNTGNNFHSKTQELIRDATPGRLLTIDEITAILNGQTRKIPSRVYQVVE